MNSTAKDNHQRSWDAGNQLIFVHFIVYRFNYFKRSLFPEVEYNNLFVALRLLLLRSPNKRQIVFANQCLRKYVYDFGVIYGAHHLVYNFHNFNSPRR
jgi:hypothetical protein